MHRWIRLDMDEFQRMVENRDLQSFQGYPCTIDGVKMREFHVDNHPNFLDCGSLEHHFGGHLSVRMSPNVQPILSLGQDEAIFKQYLSLWKAWSGSGGLKALKPKDDGLDVMVLVIVSQEFGF